jgi:hypothetical protein
MALARHNPFRAERADALEFRLQTATWDELLARFQFLRFRAAIVGKHGHGKTTLLDQFTPHLQRQGWSTHRLRLNRARRAFTYKQWSAFSSFSERDLILLDGAEQLNWLHWNRLCWKTRHAGGLLITSHHVGRLPMLFECRTSPQLLQQLAGVLAPRQDFTDATAQTLFTSHNGNIRDALRKLYDKQNT